MTELLQFGRDTLAHQPYSVLLGTELLLAQRLRPAAGERLFAVANQTPMATTAASRATMKSANRLSLRSRCVSRCRTSHIV